MTALVYILLCLIWGSTWLMIKVGLHDSPPITAAAIRFFVAISIFFIIASIKKTRFPKGFKAILLRGYPGFFMYTAGYTLLYIAEQFISSALTSVLFASFPLFVALLAFVMFKDEIITTKVWVGLLLGLAGIVIISYDSLSLSGDLFLGTTLALLGSFCSAFGMMQHKKHFAKDDILASVTIQMTVGGIPIILLAPLVENVSAFRVTFASVGSILYLAAFGSVIAFIGYYWLIARVNAVTVAFIAFITPFVAIFLGITLAAEHLTMPTIYGSSLVLGGVLLVIRRQRGPRINRSKQITS